MSRSPGPGAVPRDAGFTLVELLVAMALFAVLGTLLLGFALSSAGVTDRVGATTDATSEARLALQRMSRELRQAQDLSGAVVDSRGRVTALTLRVDFDGDGVIDSDAADPEVLTYRYDAAGQRLTLTANDADGTSITRPVLAGRVTSLDIGLRSSLWVYDSDGDGATTWQELDASSLGNRNGAPDGAEIGLVDLVQVTLTVTDGETTEQFTVRAQMRNRRQVA